MEVKGYIWNKSIIRNSLRQRLKENIQLKLIHFFEQQLIVLFLDGPSLHASRMEHMALCRFSTSHYIVFSTKKLCYIVGDKWLNMKNITNLSSITSILISISSQSLGKYGHQNNPSENKGENPMILSLSR